jgi:hypothetical protein
LLEQESFLRIIQANTYISQEVEIQETIFPGKSLMTNDFFEQTPSHDQNQ